MANGFGGPPLTDIGARYIRLPIAEAPPAQ
jgi:hypothetical protein